jgi:hypothetical protein
VAEKHSRSGPLGRTSFRLTASVPGARHVPAESHYDAYERRAPERARLAEVAMRIARARALVRAGAVAGIPEGGDDDD